jgi:hypothetical protein
MKAVPKCDRFWFRAVIATVTHFVTQCRKPYLHCNMFQAKHYSTRDMKNLHHVKSV